MQPKHFIWSINDRHDIKILKKFDIKKLNTWYNLQTAIKIFLIDYFLGPTLSNALVNAGITSFQKIEDTNPRELELVLHSLHVLMISCYNVNFLVFYVLLFIFLHFNFYFETIVLYQETILHEQL